MENTTAPAAAAHEYIFVSPSARWVKATCTCGWQSKNFKMMRRLADAAFQAHLEEAQGK